MKQIRKISNMIAEELQNALDEKGIVLDEDAFEERVSDIVSSIDEAVQITEDDKFYFAASECSVGGVKVKEGEYVELEDTDEGTKATIYDEDGNIRESDIDVDDDDDFEDSLEELEDDEDEVEEGTDAEDGEEEEEPTDEASVKKFKIKGGKKVKLNTNQLKAAKLRAAGKAKKGYKFVNGKQVKMSAAEKKARKMAGRKLARKGKVARAKSMKKARALSAGSTSGTVTETFNIHSEGITFTAEAGDVIVMEDGMISVIREGRTVMSGIEVSEDFFDRCFEAVVVEANEGAEGANCKDVGEGTEEGEAEEGKTDEAVLTFKADKGYVLVKEGSELPMGNRVRARATLVSEGFNVTSAQLDAASKGQMVTL